MKPISSWYSRIGLQGFYLAIGATAIVASVLTAVPSLDCNIGLVMIVKTHDSKYIDDLQGCASQYPQAIWVVGEQLIYDWENDGTASAMSYWRLAPQYSSNMLMARARQSSLRGDYNASLQQSLLALELNPNNQNALVEQAKAYEKLDQWNNAYSIWMKLSSITPQNSEFQYRTGLALRESGHENLAGQYFAKAAQLAPLSWRNYYAYVQYLKRFGTQDDYDNHLNILVENFPESVIANVLLAERELQIGNFVTAEQLLVDAINERPDWALPLQLRGDLYMKTNRYELALESYRQAVTTSPNVLRYHRSYYGALQAAGNDSDAKDYLCTLADTNFHLYTSLIDTINVSSSMCNIQSR